MVESRFSELLRGNVERMEAALGLRTAEWRPSPEHVQERLETIRTTASQKGVGPEKTTLIDAALTASQAWKSTLVDEASETPRTQPATALVVEEVEETAPAVQSIRARAMRKKAWEKSKDKEKPPPTTPALAQEKSSFVWSPAPTWAAGNWLPAGWRRSQA